MIIKEKSSTGTTDLSVRLRPDTRECNACAQGRSSDSFPSPTPSRSPRISGYVRRSRPLPVGRTGTHSSRYCRRIARRSLLIPVSPSLLRKPWRGKGNHFFGIMYRGFDFVPERTLQPSVSDVGIFRPTDCERSHVVGRAVRRGDVHCGVTGNCGSVVSSALR